MCKAECKDEVTSLSLCMMKEKCFEDVSLLEHFVVGSEAFEETKIHAYESPGNPQHVGMMASKKHQSSKTMSKKLKHKRLIRKRKLSKCTPSDKLKTSGIIRSPIPFKKTNQSGFENIVEHGINGGINSELSYAFRKFKGELKFEAFTQIGFSETSAFMQYSEFISRK